MKLHKDSNNFKVIEIKNTYIGTLAISDESYYLPEFHLNLI